MSTGIDEAIEHANEYTAVLRAIKKRYPDAKLERGRVCYRDGQKGIEPNTIVEVDGAMYLAEKVGDGWVFDRWHSQPKDWLLEELLKDDAVLEKAMSIVRGRS